MSIARTANINVRVEPSAKSGAEEVLNNIGISMSDAINVFCKQIVYRQALPFELSLPTAPQHLDATNWSKEKVREEVEKGIKSAETEPLKTPEETFYMLEN